MQRKEPQGPELIPWGPPSLIYVFLSRVVFFFVFMSCDPRSAHRIPDLMQIAGEKYKLWSFPFPCFLSFLSPVLCSVFSNILKYKATDDDDDDKSIGVL
jgi:hypothetical protein